MAPSKHSRKGKKAWRKNVDVSKELEVIHSRDITAAMASKPDAALFVLEPKASTPKSTVVLTKAKRKEIIRNKPLFADTRLIGQAQKTIAKSKSADHSSVSRLVSKIKAAQESQTPSLEKVAKIQSKIAYDIWADEPTPSSNRIKRVIESKEASILRMPLSAGAPGTSYRPDYEHHQQYLGKRVAVEIRRLDEEQYLEQKLSWTPDEIRNEKGLTADVAFTTLPTRATLEAKQPTADQEDNSNDENDQEEEEEKEAKEKLHYSIKLSKTERNKMMRRRIHEAIVQYHKKQKRARAQYAKLPQITAQVEKEQAEHEARMKRNERIAQYKEKQTKRLGKLKYSPTPAPYLLTGELPNSLRKLKPQGNIATELFHRMQRKNIIEPRTRSGPQKRRYAKKMKEKFSARD